MQTGHSSQNSALLPQNKNDSFGSIMQKYIRIKAKQQWLT